VARWEDGLFEVTRIKHVGEIRIVSTLFAQKFFAQNSPALIDWFGENCTWKFFIDQFYSLESVFTIIQESLQEK
jgi:hypothetical protein